MSVSLCLGTAQFGMDYGITNNIGEVNQNQINEIIRKSFLNDISFIDTAQDYGDAEKKLGASKYMDKFKIINKFSTSFKLWDKYIVNKWENNFQQSLQHMNVDQFDSFLVHNCEDLKRLDSDFLKNWLVSLKERNLIKRIGVSIYQIEDIQNLPIEYIDVFQLPLSIYDQRFLKSGLIKKLKLMGKSIFVRSIFLQGLILQDSLKWPSFLSNSFKVHHAKVLDQLKKRNLNVIEYALRFIYYCEDIDAALFGITKEKELEEILKIWKSFKKSSQHNEDPYINYAWHNIKDIDPRTWQN